MNSTENWAQLAFESEVLIAQFQNKTIEETFEFDIDNLPLGTERESLIKVRVNQSFFRSTILSLYNQKCCITGLSIPDFLVASHIVPRKKDDLNRLNLHNGLCLNAIHDKAFDRGFITITPDFKIKVSDYFKDYSKENAVLDLFTKYDNQSIILPDRFLLSQMFLDYHYNTIFRK
jgi:putative restriction endonuclease